MTGLMLDRRYAHIIDDWVAWNWRFKDDMVSVIPIIDRKS